MRYFLFFCILSIACKGVFAQQASGTNTYAVIVGISQYETGNNIPALKFADRDASEFAGFLRSRSGGSVPEHNIRLLLNENATVAAVYNALDWLTETCKKDDLVYFYFAGHGDKESQTIYNLGFLLTYNTLRPNYKNNALRIEDLNDIANTLTVTNNANVVLITDACHSGDMNSSVFHWANLVGEDLRKVRTKEIRIASCATDQLSAEDKAWGGGRGVFSWYLVNGLKGMADRDGDGIVTKNDIKLFLDSCFARDPVLLSNNLKQNPVLSGNNDFRLATIDKNVMAEARTQMAMPIVRAATLRALPMQPQDYFFNLLKNINIEDELNFEILSSLSTAQIPFAVIDSLSASASLSKGYRDTLQIFRSQLKEDNDRARSFNDKLAELIHNRGLAIIKAYLSGDAAELERRRYYNFMSSGYDEYPKMFEVAAKLTSPDSHLNRILKVDQHYFAGVVARLKIPMVEDAAPLLKTAMEEQLQAVALDDNAANIQNELGNLYLQQNDIIKAEKYYQRATMIAPEWAIPWANLCGLYALGKRIPEALNAGRIADSLQPGLQHTSMELGYTYESSSNSLLAEEFYRNAIDINSRHFLPFDRLGFVYTNTTQYATADSFFYEGDLRKKGFHFKGVGFERTYADAAILPMDFYVCSFDSNTLKKDDIMGIFCWGMSEYYQKHYNNAERIFKKIIALDKTNPMVFHYLGKVFYDQKKWENAEIMFQLAKQYWLDDITFKYYSDSLIKDREWPYDHDCFERYFHHHHYDKIEDHYFIASVYESWGHFEEAETAYRGIIAIDPKEIGGYIKLWRIMESLGRFTESEKIIRDYGNYKKDTAYNELYSFYKRAMEHYPSDPNWPYKLGLLLYDRASLPSKNVYLDTVVYFPLLNKEVFIDLEKHNTLWADLNMQQDRGPSNAPYQKPAPQVFYEDTLQVILPGTHEKLTTSGMTVYTPRLDAITYLTKAAALIKEPELLADINFKTGNVYVWAGSKKQAFPYYNESIEMAPENAATRLRMIDVAHALYKNRTTLENLEYLYDKKQINFPGRMLLAESDIHAGNFAMAKKLLTEAEAIHPYDLPAIHDLTGRLFLLSNKPLEALPWYTKYLSEIGKDAGTLYTIGRLYAQMGKTPEAWTWLETALKAGFNYSWVLKYDPVWGTYRNSAQWKQLIARFPNIRTYASK